MTLRLFSSVFVYELSQCQCLRRKFHVAKELTDAVADKISVWIDIRFKNLEDKVQEALVYGTYNLKRYSRKFEC